LLFKLNIEVCIPKSVNPDFSGREDLGVLRANFYFKLSLVGQGVTRNQGHRSESVRRF